jgi:hypothetical protein
VDDDDDGWVDCDDPDCADDPMCSPIPPPRCYPTAGVIGADEGVVIESLSTADSTGGPRGTGYYYDAYEIWLEVGDELTLEAIDASFDTYLYLVGPTCNQVALDDDGGSGLLSRLTYTANENGPYTVIMTSYSSGITGSYALSYSRNASPTPPYEIDCGDGEDDDRDGWVDCEDPDCEGFPECEPPPEHCFGTWQELIGPGEIVDGELDPGDPTGGPRGAAYYFDAYELFGGEGMSLWIETIDGDFDTYLYVLNEYCEVVAYDDDGGEGLLSQIELGLPDDGRYTIVVTSWDSYYTGYYLLGVF